MISSYMVFKLYDFKLYGLTDHTKFWGEIDYDLCNRIFMTSYGHSEDMGDFHILEG